MWHGIDTDFLVAAEVSDHAFHAGAAAVLDRVLDEGGHFAVAAQTLAEFIHVVTDAKRLVIPLTMTEAIDRAGHWWNAAEVVRVFPTASSTADFFDLLRQHRLGRKRLLDTQLASIYREAGVQRLITNNGADYRVFGCFEILGYK